MAFDRKKFMEKRHQLAKMQRDYFKKEFPEKDLPEYSKFLKNDSPIRENIVAYQVSFQLSYRGSNDDMIFQTAHTFNVYGLRGQESEIQEKTMNSVLDAKGESSGDSFKPNTIEMIENNAKVDVLPRGMEQTQKNKLSDKELRQVLQSGIAFDYIPNKIKFKNKKNREGEMKLDLRHFI